MLDIESPSNSDPGASPAQSPLASQLHILYYAALDSALLLCFCIFAEMPPVHLGEDVPETC